MILVTGATGLVGSYLLHYLLKDGQKVRALLHSKKSLDRTRHIFRSLSDDADELINQVEWIEGDVLDVMLLSDAMKGVREVYHSAAIVSFDQADKDIMMKVNVEGTCNVVNMALEAGVAKLCHVSSIASLGRTDESNLIDENSEWRNSNANTVYARSKYMSEREVWRASAEGLPVVIVNPSIIFGYGHPEKGSTRIFKTIHNMPYFYGKGINGFVDVQDVVRAMIALMNSDIQNERFVVSGGNFSYKEIFCMIAAGFQKPQPRLAIPSIVLDTVCFIEAFRSKLTGDKPFITKETARTSRNDYYYSSEKLINAINFKFTPMEETIGSLCKAMQSEFSFKTK